MSLFNTIEKLHHLSVQLVCYFIMRVIEAYCAKDNFLLDFHTFITLSPFNAIEKHHHLSMQLFFYSIIKVSQAHCAKDNF